MRDPSPSSQPESGIPPAAAWVRFLRSYGPTPNDLNLFDEHITKALGRAKVRPISLESPQLAAMRERLGSGAPGSILIAGTAGDGKTYHCRSLWAAFGGGAKEWAVAEPVQRLTLPDRRTAVFVKDLSGISDERESDEVLDLLERTVFGNDDSTVLVIAANHGQILERLRGLGVRQERVHPLRKPIQDAFLLAGSAPDRLAIFDLSRTARRHSLADVISAVAGHPEWEKCSGCQWNEAGRVCPIFENKKRLLGEDDGGRFARRLGDLVEISRHNGWHLPVRDLLMLASNMILGHRDAKEGLLSCSEVAKILDVGKTEYGSVYDNVFGTNLPRRRAYDRQVFRVLAAFSIGKETTNRSDGMLVYGADDSKLASAFDKLVKADPIYGATPSYLSAQMRYLEGDEEARLDDGAADFLSRLESQRRRLFFTLPDNDADHPFWGMTAFNFAGDYLELISALAGRRSIGEAVRARLAKGLNRVMTGLLVENSDRIFVASSGGFTQSRISVLCNTETPARRQGGMGMQIRIDPQTELPSIEMALAPGADRAVTFNLSPVRFEFLCRVAEGSLPGSFSNECLEDMLAFKAKLLRKAELIRDKLAADDETDEDAGALTLNFIEIETNGHGFTRPVTVRVGL
ncbi:MAG: hypothetical protein HQL64_08890 [Magnetococcales bacterium]|nr:hypothetical protein [Magnetococcales bacterium]